MSIHPTCRTCVCTGLLMTVAFLGGCEPKNEVKEVPPGMKLGEQAEKLGLAYTNIKEGLEAGDKAGFDAAHDDLHTVTDILRAISRLAPESSLSVADREKLVAATEAMADLYGQIDGSIDHSAEDPVADLDYSEYAEPLSQALNTIETLCQ